MAGAGSEAGAVVLVARRRRRQRSRRRYRVEFSCDQEEYAELREAAGAAGLALGAYAAAATLGAARGGGGGGGPLLRDALAWLVRCEEQVRKVGGELNRAVAKLNATGQADGNLALYAAAAIRSAGRLEEAAGQVRRAAASAAPGRGDGGGQLLHQALTGLVRCAAQVRRIGTNLNQAVAKLNATGQADGNLALHAAAAIRIAERLDEEAEQVRRMVAR